MLQNYLSDVPSWLNSILCMSCQTTTQVRSCPFQDMAPSDTTDRLPFLEILIVTPGQWASLVPQRKEFACNAGTAGDTVLIPGLGRSPGEANGNPLWYSCLENPTDRGAWQAAVHRVTKSWIQLKWLSMHSRTRSICCPTSPLCRRGLISKTRICWSAKHCYWLPPVNFDSSALTEKLCGAIICLV